MFPAQLLIDSSNGLSGSGHRSTEDALWVLNAVKVHIDAGSFPLYTTPQIPVYDWLELDPQRFFARDSKTQLNACFLQ